MKSEGVTTQIITHDVGSKNRSENEFYAYVECSASERYNVDQVFY